MVQGLGFGVQGLGCRILGFRGDCRKQSYILGALISRVGFWGIIILL